MVNPQSAFSGAGWADNKVFRDGWPRPDAGALAAGASEVAPISEAQGWRIVQVADPFGHHWEIGMRQYERPC